MGASRFLEIGVLMVQLDVRDGRNLRQALAATSAVSARGAGRALAALLASAAELSFETFIVHSSIVGRSVVQVPEMTQLRRRLFSISGGISTSIVITIEITSLASA